MDIIKIITISIALIGLIGSIVPIIPGITLMFIGIVFYGFFTGFADYSYGYILFALFITIFSYVIEYGASIIGTKHFGGSKASMLGAIGGGLVGVISLGPVGLIIGPIVGAILGELFISGNFQKSVKIGLGTITGIIAGTTLKLILAIILFITLLQKIL
ncbi:MAG: DUF456 domain-containing protein [Clostridia bacterium]|nr:DUF456 domain-containing protein [Clostridia bacterium]